jgi:hypothetical protein
MPANIAGIHTQRPLETFTRSMCALENWHGCSIRCRVRARLATTLGLRTPGRPRAACTTGMRRRWMRSAASCSSPSAPRAWIFTGQSQG